MSKRQLLCLLGVWIIIFLFLGFPKAWLEVFAVISGLLVIAVSYSLPAPIEKDLIKKETFVENKQP